MGIFWTCCKDGANRILLQIRCQVLVKKEKSRMTPRILAEQQTDIQWGQMQQELGAQRNQGTVSIHVKCNMSAGQLSENEHYKYMSRVQGKSQDMQFKSGNDQ